MVSGVTRDTYLITEKKSEQKIVFHHGEKHFSKNIFQKKLENENFENLERKQIKNVNF